MKNKAIINRNTQSLERKIKKYHMDIIKTINDSINKGKKEIFIDMGPGTGLMQVIKKWIISLQQEQKILIVLDRRLLTIQFNEYFNEFSNVEICLYKDIIEYSNINYIVIVNTENLKQEEYTNLLKLFNNTIFIFFSDIIQSIVIHNNWLSYKKFDYRLENFQDMDENYLDEEAENLIERLKNIEPGKERNNDKKYEKICSDIIMYLFKDEFTKIYKNTSTKDNMFEMDLICGIKGKYDFFKILINHYNTRLLVFEFKNYKEEISQNLIYTTEKYLYNAALRNVAIIISRNGFSNNAYKAAVGTLTENNKLILDLTDEDLVEMIIKKSVGESVDEYLLNRLQDFLVSISK